MHFLSEKNPLLMLDQKKLLSTFITMRTGGQYKLWLETLVLFTPSWVRKPEVLVTRESIIMSWSIIPIYIFISVIIILLTELSY